MTKYFNLNAFGATYEYDYDEELVQTFQPGESSFPIEKATEKEKGEDYGEEMDE